MTRWAVISLVLAVAVLGLAVVLAAKLVEQGIL